MASRRSGPKEREAVFQGELFYQLKKALEQPFSNAGITLANVVQEHPVQSGRADIVVFDHNGKPFLVVETKRPEGPSRGDIDPLSPKVIKQAYSNAGLVGAPYFATANRGYIAVFQVPSRGESFDMGKHRVFLASIKALNRDLIRELFTTVTAFESAPVSKQGQVATKMDWAFIIRLRSFVDWLYGRVLHGLPEQLKDKKFAARVEQLGKETGVDIKPEQLAREMAYILMNKIIFYKALERSYKDLPKLRLDDVETMAELVGSLSHAWEQATIVTRDFEAIFSSRIYDELPFNERHYDLLDIQDGLQGFVEDMDKYHLEKIEADVIGHVYEHVIPPEERHLLGQVYTPPTFAEFLAQWAIRSPTDRVLDPASGSGTFVVKAYQHLSILKTKHGIQVGRGTRHREVLSQVFGIDINPFPAQLTAMNLAMRDLLHPVSEMNILERDFFKVAPGQEALVPYKVRMPTGEEARSIKVPFFDVILANPPYTRWSELTDDTKKAVNGRLGHHLQKYGMKAAIRSGIETALYQHFVISAADFLKEGGRCGFLISNSWLSTDIGIKFAKFLLDHFKVHAVLDLGPRIFPLPLVAANMLLLERCSNEEERNATDSIFAFIDRPLDIQQYHDLVQDPTAATKDLLVKKVKQSEIPRDHKWIDVLFRDKELDDEIAKKTIRLDRLFETTRGTIQYCADHNRGLGANPFFFLDQDRAQQFNLPESFLVPTIPSTKDMQSYTFTNTDWENLRKAGKEVYAFHAHMPRDAMPQAVKLYVRWGETKCRNREDDICSESGACKERVGKPEYFGWYDFGTIREAVIAVPRHNAYRPRFQDLQLRGLAINEGIECLQPKVDLSTLQRQAALAVLNSSLVHMQLELAARSTGGGALDVDPQHVHGLQVPDVTQLKESHVLALAKAFRDLEHEARRIGGTSREGLEKLVDSLQAIDQAVAASIGMSEENLERVQFLANALLERRTQRAPDAQPEFMKGGSAARMEGPPRTNKESVEPAQKSTSLFDYT